MRCGLTLNMWSSLFSLLLWSVSAASTVTLLFSLSCRILGFHDKEGTGCIYETLDNRINVSGSWDCEHLFPWFSSSSSLTLIIFSKKVGSNWLFINQHFVICKTAFIYFCPFVRRSGCGYIYGRPIENGRQLLWEDEWNKVKGSRTCTLKSVDSCINGADVLL